MYCYFNYLKSAFRFRKFEKHSNHISVCLEFEAMKKKGKKRNPSPQKVVFTVGVTDFNSVSRKKLLLIF